MRHSVISLSILFFVFALSSCGTAQKMSKKELEKRVASLEEENANIKKEMEVIKAQVRVLLQSLPKPGRDTRSGRPEYGGGGNGQVAANATSIEFEKTIHDFGELKDGESVSYTFRFTNTGTNPLTISNAKGSCGCTVPKWPKEPIAPGEKGEIQVTFNSKGKSGNQHKSVTLTANTNPASSRLYIKAVVNKAN